MSQIWKTDKEKDREKEKVRRQASEAEREKELERDRKNKGDIFCWRINIKFCSGGEKMRNASGHLGENERRWQKSEQQHGRHFLHKTCNQEASGSFTFWSCKTTAKKCTTKCAACAKLFFLLFRPILGF